MRHERRCSFVSGCLAALVMACAPQRATLAPARSPEATAHLRAGAASVEITPPPGFAMGGHSVEGGTAIGTWTPLMARAIYVEDTRGEATVLVAADLWAIPAGLGDAVSERLRAHPGLEHLGREAIVLAATHTHHGPGNYSSNRFYNAFASPRLGYDPDLHAFLAERIALAIADAAASAEPAQLFVNERPLGEQARNRNPLPFAQNPDAQSFAARHTRLPGCAREGEPVDRCHAIDPTLRVLRIQASNAEGPPLALVAVWAAHTTALRNRTDVFHADVSGIAALHAERRLAEGEARPVVAVFNGAEGDVSPNWRQQRPGEARRLGRQLGEALVRDAAEARAPLEGEVENRFRRVPLGGVASGEGVSARRALPGRAILGGAEDGRTRYHEKIPPGQRVKRERRRGQGAKRPAVPPALFALGFPGESVPREVPIGIVDIGPLRMVALPGEFTTMSGLAVRRAVEGEQYERVWALGLANEYLSYFTTPPEYALQHYEGGSTLYGEHSLAVMVDAYASLAHEAPAPRSSDTSQNYRTGATRRFALTRSTPRARKLVRSRRDGVRALLDAEAPRRVRMHVPDAPPTWTPGGQRPRVHVERLTPEGWRPWIREGRRVDDSGDEFVTWLDEARGRRWRWNVAWVELPEEGSMPPDVELRLHVRGVDGVHHCSGSFSVPGSEGELELDARDCQ